MTDIEYDEFGKPIRDGYTTVVFKRAPILRPLGRVQSINGMDDCILTIDDIECYEIKVHEVGLVFRSKNLDVVYKWDQIHEYQQTFVSDEFMDAMNMFRLECGEREGGHTWINEQHTAFGCSHVCGRCDLVENPHANGRHEQP